MDEYLVEMNDLRRQIARLKFEKADLAIIEELEAQLRILRAIYDATGRLFSAGEEDEELQARFREHDLGDWNFENVYFYVYEEAIKIDPGNHDLASRVSVHDFRAAIASQGDGAKPGPRKARQ